MTAHTSVFKTMFALLTHPTSASTARRYGQNAEMIAPAQDDEQAFLVSIASLPQTEQYQHIQKHEWYKRLAQRQGIVEAEHTAELYWLAKVSR